MIITGVISIFIVLFFMYKGIMGLINLLFPDPPHEDSIEEQVGKAIIKIIRLSEKRQND